MFLVIYIASILCFRLLGLPIRKPSAVSQTQVQCALGTSRWYIILELRRYKETLETMNTKHGPGVFGVQRPVMHMGDQDM